MNDLIAYGGLVLAVAVVVLLILNMRRRPSAEQSRLEGRISSVERMLGAMELRMMEEHARNREEGTLNAQRLRDEVNGALHSLNNSLLSRLSESSGQQRSQIETLTDNVQRRLERMRDTLDERLNMVRDENAKKLDEMRAVVDEKLHATLERRLGESFRLVSERLDLVHRGLGEMQSLASSVGDLKRVFANVKTRGMWGEVQLGNLLEQVLTKDQFECNVATKRGSAERVEFAIRLPGRDDTGDIIRLPVDAKFPHDDYERLVEAQERGDVPGAEEASRSLEARIKTCAREIRDKYLDPPFTTDFAVLFLPIEGLYAEVLRRPGLCEQLQREYRVTVTGPTTLAAFLNSLQMGFRTLAIEHRSGEVWRLLGAVKTEFGKFGDILDKTHRKLQEASSSIETATRKSRTIERKLQEVQEMPPESSLPGVDQ
ncbi:MAG TPA: DNA recombination protein RmuC [Dissulfurispiraceae bacterium]|nr:DNA recombination protein RmuC [Dissulfurispiraceae bacterium]